MPGFLSAEFSSFLHFARVALRHVRLLTCAALQVDSILIDEAWLGRRLRRDMREDPNRMKSVEKEGHVPKAPNTGSYSPPPQNPSNPFLEETCVLVTSGLVDLPIQWFLVLETGDHVSIAQVIQQIAT